jgi:hypothetical protein
VYVREAGSIYYEDIDADVNELLYEDFIVLLHDKEEAEKDRHGTWSWRNCLTWGIQAANNYANRG